MNGQPPFIRYYGNEDHAKLFLRPARIELGITVDVALKNGFSVYQRRVMLDEETGTYALLRIDQGTESITITSPVPHDYELPPIPPPVEFEPEFQDVIFPLGIWGGLAHIHHSLYDLGGDPERPTEAHPWMKEFHPTQVCFKQYEEEFPAGLAYQDVARLALEVNDDLTYPGDQDEYGPSPWPPGGSDWVTQSDMVRPCTFTSLLADAACLVTGYGTFNVSGTERLALLKSDAHTDWKNTVENDGFRLEYDWRWDRCHGIVVADDGSKWLVECSYTNGIIGRKLPMLNQDLVKVDALDNDLKAAVQALGGFPSGEAFPYNFGGVETATYKILMTASEYRTTFLDLYESYKEWVGWAFDGGKHARNCGYEATGQGTWDIAKYWELQFNINPRLDKYTAVITELHSEELWYNKWINDYGGIGVQFYDPYNKRYDSHYPIGSDGTGATTWDIPVWVTWMDNHWSEARFRGSAINNIVSPSKPQIIPSDLIGGGSWGWSSISGTGSPQSSSIPDPGAIWTRFGFCYTTEINKEPPVQLLGDRGYIQSNGSVGSEVTSYHGQAWLIVQGYTDFTVNIAGPSGAGLGENSILVSPYCRSAYMFISWHSVGYLSNKAFISRFRHYIDNDSYIDKNVPAGPVPDTISTIHFAYTADQEVNPPFNPGTPYPYVDPTGAPDPYPGYLFSNIPISYYNHYRPVGDNIPFMPAWDHSFPAYEPRIFPSYVSGHKIPTDNNSLRSVYSETFTPLADNGIWVVPAKAPGHPDSGPIYREFSRAIPGSLPNLHEGKYVIEAWLVGDKVPGNEIHFPEVTYDDSDYEYGIGFFKNHFWQTSVLGPPAAIYTNPTESVNPADPYEFFLKVESQGVMPPMPSGADQDTERTVSFVGVNGP